MTGHDDSRAPVGYPAPMLPSRLFLLLCALCAQSLAAPSPSCFSLQREITGLPGSAEILAFDPGSRRLLSTVSDRDHGRLGVQFIDPDSGEVLDNAYVDLAAALDRQDLVASGLTSVAVDPRGSGLAAAALLPEPAWSARGWVALFDLRTARVHAIVPVGFHPDSLDFDTRGRHLLIANEGEYALARNNPGSLGVIEIRGPRRQPRFNYVDYPFTAAALAPGLSTAGLRYPVPGPDQVLDLEPEYVIAGRRQAYLSLQENNAVAVFDLRSRRFTRLHDLGLRRLDMDASDRDGPDASAAAAVDDSLLALPLPDGIASFRHKGRPYVITANEGDTRSDNADSARVYELIAEGRGLDPEFARELALSHGEDPLAESRLGRLRVSRTELDPDGDGDIDRFVTFGSRGFSIIDADSGRQVYDSGDFIERWVAEHDSELFNINGAPGTLDHRSTAAGPEPEAVAVIRWKGHNWMFLAVERQNGIFAFRLDDPSHPTFMGYWNGFPRGHVSPESIVPLPPSRRGEPMRLAVGFELSHSIAILTCPETP